MATRASPTRTARLRTACALALLLASARAQAPRPNIVVILADDHATAAIGAYGSPVAPTPRLDALAAQGALFTSSFCANALCAPSRATILTGTHAHVHGVRRNGDRLDPSHATFPALLQSAGYRTALVGKWHLGADPAGFDHWEVLPGQGHYYEPDFVRADGTHARREGYVTDVITDLALAWIDEARGGEAPFLLLVHHKAPHRNWAPAPRHLALLDAIDVPPPPTLLDDMAGRTALLAENEMTIARHMHWAHDMKLHGDVSAPGDFVDGLPNAEYDRMTSAQRSAWDAHYEPANAAFLQALARGALSDEDVVRWKHQRFVEDYLACVAAIDEGVGRILDHLEAAGLARDTLVLYGSDHGVFLGEHGLYDKRWMFEEALRTPLIVRWPGVVPPGARPEALVQTIDWAPTLLDAAGVPIPDAMQGESLLPLLRESGHTPPGWRDAIYAAYYENASVHAVPVHDGVRTAHHKLIHLPRTREWQLFDLDADPLELTSVHAHEDHLPAFAAMRQRYDDLRALYGVNPATIPASRGDEDWWAQRMEAVNARVAQGGWDIVFVGDSITQGWEDAGRAVWDAYYGHRRALNLGFSGDRTEHVLWRLDHGNLDGLAPRVAVVMVGTNNTGHSFQEPAQVAEGVRAIVARLLAQSERTSVLLLEIFPRGEDRDDPLRVNNDGINRHLRALHDGGRVRVLDISDEFLLEDGTLPAAIMPDLLHLDAVGYRLWAEALEPSLRALGV